MPARFDDSIPFDGDQVVAIGPLHPGDEILEACAWVFQPSGDRTQDAAATEMTTNKAAQPHFDQRAQRWLLVLKRIDENAARFRYGRAFAVAVALVRNRESGEDHVVWWGQPVDLFTDAARVAAAVADQALTNPLLQTPAPFPPPQAAPLPPPTASG